MLLSKGGGRSSQLKITVLLQLFGYLNCPKNKCYHTCYILFKICSNYQLFLL